MAATSLKASQQALDNLVDPARIRKHWNQHDQRWAEAAEVSLKTLQRFWSREAIRRANFIAICQAIEIENWQTIVDDALAEIFATPVAPSFYNTQTWVERAELTQPLLQVLRGQYRVVAFTGITGIGKTEFAGRLISELNDEKRFCRLNLDEGGITSDFVSSGAALLRELGEEPTLEDQKDTKNLLNHLLQLLRTQPYRVQIDSMEKLLEGNDEDGWSEFCDPLWLDLLQQVLSGNQCQSQLILTTQDVPGALAEIGARYEQLWYCEPIRGLNPVQQLELFQKRGLPADSESTDYLQRIGKLYAGHPLVLRVIAEDIKTCGGDVKRYWQLNKFAELEANRPAELSRPKLQLEVKRRVRAALSRLPQDALDLLCRSAVFRRPVPEAFWLAMLPDCPEPEAALNSLKSRALAEEDWEPGVWLGADEAIPLRQHNLIRAVAYELLKVDETTWQTAERQAAELWLSHYEPAPNAPNLEKVRGYLEAFEHYCEVEDWQAAKVIVFEQNLGLQLQTWGHYQEMIELYSRLANCLNATDEVARLKGLGNGCLLLSKCKQAISYYQQSLELACEIGDRQGEGAALGNLGNAYDFLGSYTQAIEYHQQALIIAREIRDRRGEGADLGSLGNAYYSLGNYTQAIEYHQQHLAIAREIGDRQGEGNALGNLGISFTKLERYSEALENLQLVLEMFKQIGNRSGEAEVLKQLALLHQKTGSIELAHQYCDRALQLAIELGIPLAEECRKLKAELKEEK